MNTVGLAQSTISVAPASIQAGGTTTVTLTTKDSAGNAETSGGLTVAFGLGGTGSATGTFGSVTDNHNGTYTATFTAGTNVGTNTITATVNGQAVTSTHPTITVTSPFNTSLSLSTIGISPGSLPVGATATVTLVARDTSGTQESSGGLSVVFGLGNGTNVGTFGQVTDHNDGTYTATFTASAVGNNTVTATIGGQAVTSASPTVTVTQAVLSLAQSSVTVNPGSIVSGGTATVTLTARDTQGHQQASGGLVVSFQLGNGVAGGSFGQVADNHDGTYTALFTGTIAGTNTIKATINNQSVTATAPTITVTPGAASLATSTISITPSSVASGSSATVKLIAKDAAGNQETSGGLTVTFGLGAGTASGSFGSTTDNNDGTYTASFLASTVGTNTITAKITGQAVTSTSPTVTVTQGPASLANSVVTVAPNSIQVQTTATVTLTAKDSSGLQEGSGGLTVVFHLGNGSATGTFGNVTDNHNGTYTATFTATGVGTNTISATIGGQSVTSAPATITVTPVAFSLAKSTVTVSPNSVAADRTATITLTVRDGNGNQITTGGLTVAFGLAGGAATGTIGPVTDNNNGTYTGTFTGNLVGNNTVTATINGQAVTSPAPALSVTPGPTGTIASDTPVFAWTPVAGITTYDLWIGDNTSHQQPVFENKTVAATSFSMATLAASQALTPGHSYTWYAGAVSGKNITWGSGTNFTVAALTAPTPTSPTGAVATTQPTFSWAAAPTAASYELWITDQTTGHVVTYAAASRATSLTLSAAQALTAGHSYVWYIGAVSTNGKGFGWSAGVNIRIAPALVSPSGTVNTDQPTFSWNALAGAASNQFYIQDQSTSVVTQFSTGAATTVTLTAAQALTPGHTFIWYAGSVIGSTTIWSAGQTITVAAMTAAQPIAPAANASLTTTQPTFSWTAGVGGVVAGSYELWIQDQSTKTIMTVPNLPLAQTSYTLTSAQGLTPGHGFVWYIGAVSTNGKAIAWNSTGVGFTVAAIGTPTPNTPKTQQTTDMPTFAWTAPVGGTAPSTYELYIQDTKTKAVQTIPNLPTSSTTYTLTVAQALNPGHAYVWYVGAVSASGSAISWSGSVAFSIAAMGTPTPNTPSGTIATLQPTFVWAAATGTGATPPSSYEIWLLDTTTQKVVTFPGLPSSSTSYTLTVAQALTHGHAYGWYIGAVSANGQTISWSNAITFTVS